MAKLIHYHTDCPFFAGCENMLTSFWSSSLLRCQFEVRFSYRASERYNNDLKQRILIDFPVYPMRFPDLSVPAILPKRWPELTKRGVMLCVRLLFTVPVLSYEVWALRRLFLSVRPTILHINSGGYPTALSSRAAVIAAWLARVPFIVMVVNNLAVDYSRPSRWLSYPVDRLIARAVTRFVTGSVVAARQLQKVLRLNSGKCLPLHNGVALRQITETCRETRKRLGLERFDGVVFGVVAVLRPNKGHQVLLEAIIRLLREAPGSNIKILIEGDGPLLEHLQSYVAENQLSNHCVFIGDEKNVMNFIAFLDVLVLPSIDEEDFPNVILEAMGLGKPVIASRLAGTPEQVVDGETGILVEPRDPDQLATAIEKLSLDEQLRVQMGEAGLRRFQEYFTAEVAVKNYVSLYQSLFEV